MSCHLLHVNIYNALPFKLFVHFITPQPTTPMYFISILSDRPKENHKVKFENV